MVSGPFTAQAYMSDDKRDYYTGVCFNDKGDGKSVHFSVENK
jgi:hypothetical protein